MLIMLLKAGVLTVILDRLIAMVITVRKSHSQKAALQPVQVRRKIH